MNEASRTLSRTRWHSRGSGRGALRGARDPLLYAVPKRAIDVAAACVLLHVLAPLLLVLAAAIRLTSPGPAIFRQERVGRDERPFMVWKFRTMHVHNDDRVHRRYVERLLTEDTPPDGGQPGVYKLAADPRVTRVGAFLRRTSLDELPQLVNVLNGTMSLVGPRPALQWEVELYRPVHRQRFLVKPGMTGLWQVSGRNTVGMRAALDIDVEYVRRRSLGLDLSILLKTIPAMFRDRSAR